MSLPLLENITDTGLSHMGSLWIVSLAIIVFFIMVLIVMGVDFRFSLMITLPLFIVFSNYGWLPKWVGGVLWILVVMLAGYFLYIMIKDRF